MEYHHRLTHQHITDPVSITQLPCQ